MYMNNMFTMNISLFILIIGFLASYVTTNQPQECVNRLDGQLLIAEKDKIWRINRDGEDRTAILNETTNPLDLEYDLTRDIIYWCEPQSREIRLIDFKSSKNSQLAISKQTNWLPIAIALDYLSNKLYVAEGFSDTVQMFEPGSKYGPVVILGANASELKDIVVDPYKGYLFVLDRYQIFRTDLDGENYKTLYLETGNVYDIVSELPTFFRNILDYGIQRGVGGVVHDNKLYKKPLSVADIALDLEERRLYWINNVRQRVESMNYEGRDFRTHFEDKSVARLEESSAIITVIDDGLFYANEITEKVTRIDVNNGSDSQIILKNIKPRSIKGITCTAHRNIIDPCLNSNCEQICVRSRINKSKYRCACDFGYELADDGFSCMPLRDFLLYTQNQYLRGRLLNATVNGNNGLIDVLNPTRYELGSRVVIDYDAEENLLYYTGLYPKNRLHRIDLDTGKESVLQMDILGKDVDQFAYDWTTRNIYYFGHYYADATTLSVANVVTNSNRSKLLLEDVKGLVRGLVLYPELGYLFYGLLYEDEGRASINRLGMDGSNLTVIVDANQLDSFDGLALDYEEERIYWSQAQRTLNGVWRVHIRHSDFNGEDIIELNLPDGNLGRPDSLVVYADSLYAIISGETLVKLDKHTGTGLTNLVSTETPGLLGGLKLFSRAFQNDANWPCVDMGCEKLCLLSPIDDSRLSRPVCDCPYGEKIADDGKSCEDNRDLEPAFLHCDFESFKCNKRKAKAGSL